MGKLRQNRGKGKRSNVEAVAGGTATAPGRRAKGSPHGSNARLCIVPLDGGDDGYDVVMAQELGDLRVRHLIVLVQDLLTLEEAKEELANWSEGTGLPTTTYDPAAGWPK